MSTEPTLVSLVNKTIEQANFSTGSDQLKWIEEDLAHVDRCKTPWVILGGHRPMYIDSTYGGNPASDLVRAGRFSKYEEQGQNIHVLVYVAFTNILCALLLSLSLSMLARMLCKSFRNMWSHCLSSTMSMWEYMATIMRISVFAHPWGESVCRDLLPG